MKEIWLLTVENAVQVGEDVLIVPFLATDKYRFSLQSIERIKIVKSDNQIIEKDANFGIPFDADVYILLIPNSQKMRFLSALKFGSKVFRTNYL